MNREVSYSVSMDIEGYIVEKLSGQTLPDFMRDHIYLPLDMSGARAIPEFCRRCGPTSESRCAMCKRQSPGKPSTPAAQSDRPCERAG